MAQAEQTQCEKAGNDARPGSFLQLSLAQEPDMPGKGQEGTLNAKKEETEAFDLFLEKLKACRLCQEQFGFEPRPVQWGSQDARIVMISQAPGQKVQMSGKPFSDLSGRKLRQKWFLVSEEQFYNPHNFYFSMAGHCFPGKNARGTDRKPPRCCWPKWGSRELDCLTACRLYIVIGQEAASRLFPGRRLEDLVFSDLTLRGKPCFVLPHPSPLNYRWPLAHPRFEAEVLPRLQQALYQVLELPLSQQTDFLSREHFPKESWQK